MSSTTSTRATLGPLTELWVPPATCSILGVGDSTAGAAYQAQHCFTAIGQSGSSSTTVFPAVADDATCWPPRAPGVTSVTPPFGAWGFYSPGLICPAGYTTACASALDSNGGPSMVSSYPLFPFNFPILPDETAIGCCPTGPSSGTYYCIGEATLQTCVSYASTGTLQVTQCGATDHTKTLTYDITLPITAATPSVSTMAIYAPLFQLNWQSQDREAITIVHSTITTIQTGKSTHTGSPGGLDTGDKAGIGVGVGVFVLLVLGVLLGWCLIRLRKSSSARPPDGHGYYDNVNSENPKYGPRQGEISGTPLSELGHPNGESFKYGRPHGEISGTPLSELEHPRSELPERSH